MYRVGYYVNMHVVGYINYIFYRGFFSGTSLEADLETLRFACRFLGESSGEQHLLRGRSGGSKSWQKERLSYDAATTEASANPLGSSGAGRTLQSYPNGVRDTKLLNSCISQSLTAGFPLGGETISGKANLWCRGQFPGCNSIVKLQQ